MRVLAYPSYGSAGVLRLEDRPVPELQPNEILVQVAATSVNPGDWRLRNGQFKRFMKLDLPFVPCSDVAGVVSQVGEGVTSVGKGASVFAMTPLKAGGGCAEYARVAEHLVALAPRAIPLTDAAALPLAGLTALQGLRHRGRLRAGQSLLVVGGSGGVGHLAIQIGKAFGASVTALCGARSFDFVRRLGADTVADYLDPLSFEGPARFDLVFDTIATSSFARYRRVLRAGGTLVTVNPVVGKILPDFVTWMFGVPHLRSLFVQPKREDLVALKTMVDAGQLKPAVQQRFTMEQAPAAFRLSEEGHVQGKLVIDIAGHRS